MPGAITPLQYYGGKSMLSSWIIKHFPEHHTYVEVFGGSAAVLLRKEPTSVEVYNDLDNRVVNFFRVLRDGEKCGKLMSMVMLTPYSVEEYYASLDTLRGGKDLPDVDMAYAYFVANRMSFSGKIWCGWSYNIKGSSRGPSKCVSDWLSALDIIPQTIARFKTVQIENEDFRFILERYDTPDTLFYLDPPYYGVTNEYAFGMSEEDQEDLLTILIEDVVGMVVLSGYDSELYDELLDYDWMRVDKDCQLAANKVKGKARSRRIESLWLSPQVADWYKAQES